MHVQESHNSLQCATEVRTLIGNDWHQISKRSAGESPVVRVYCNGGYLLLTPVNLLGEVLFSAALFPNFYITASNYFKG